MWPIHVLCNIMDRISSFVYVNEKFCNKKLIFGLVQCSVNRFPMFLLLVEFVQRQWYCMKCIGKELEVQEMKKE